MGFKEYADNDKKVSRAKDFAIDKHAGQVRKFDLKPYHIHPEKVADIVKSHGGSEEEITAAWLHDTVEDTDVTLEQLTELFGSVVSGLVGELTSPALKDKSKKGEMLVGKMNAMSSPALTIKLADRLHNVSDFPSAPKNFIRGYKRETEFIINNLKDDLTEVQRKIIEDIIKTIERF